jgi:hypothetical protein
MLGCLEGSLVIASLKSAEHCLTPICRRQLTGVYLIIQQLFGSDHVRSASHARQMWPKSIRRINLEGNIFVATMTSAVLPSFGPIEFLLPPA